MTPLLEIAGLIAGSHVLRRITLDSKRFSERRQLRATDCDMKCRMWRLTVSCSKAST